jgi:hypothetical protein
VKTLLFKRFFHIVLFSLLAFPLQAKKTYTEVPALIHLASNEQDDTSGFNLVEHLPGLLYEKILNGSLKLWDSPKKQVLISSNALQNIEKSNNVTFSKSGHLFINELWSGTRRKTDFVIIGFSFLSESPKGKISFGYVDIQEAMNILASNYIPCNVNGPALLTYIDALYSRRYHFNLLQFGNKDFSVNPTQSLQIKNDAFYSKKKINGLYQLPKTKMVTYTIEKNAGLPNDMGTEIVASIENFLNSNREVFFNIGGDKYFDYQNKNINVTITRVEITEIWEKNSNQITFKPYKIRIFVNNKPLNELQFSDVANWQLLFNFKSFEDVLKEKSFEYNLYKINSELIYFTDSPLYIKALKDYKWSQVSYYVKYSRN